MARSDSFKLHPARATSTGLTLAADLADEHDELTRRVLEHELQRLPRPRSGKRVAAEAVHCALPQAQGRRLCRELVRDRARAAGDTCGMLSDTPNSTYLPASMAHGPWPLVSGLWLLDSGLTD